MLTKTEILSLLELIDFTPKKTLGQNFVIDKNLLQAIVEGAEVDEGDFVLEFGTGLGVLTGYLAQKAEAVFTVEIDEDLQRLAKKQLASYPNITYHLGDALETKNKLASDWLEKLPDRPVKVVANLPYNIASPLIVLLLQSRLKIERLVVLVQREVAEKLQAQAGDSNYGRLSVSVQALAQVSIERYVPPQVFWPAPRVESAVVEIVPHRDLSDSVAWALDQILRSLFSQRRKQMSSTFPSPIIPEGKNQEDIFEACGLDSRIRPESIEVEKYLCLAREVARK